MESESRKRKMNSEAVVVEEEEENEEETIEKFFALIRSTREVRDRLKSNLDGSKEKEEKKPVAVWNPSFQPEDFMEGAKLKTPLETQAGPSKKDEETKKEEEEGNGIDLNLSL